jgi:uncharacterized protein YbgA (DUF1722 family)
LSHLKKQVTLDDVHSFILEQFEKTKNTNQIKNLVHFHTINKYLFLIHSQSGLRSQGKLVANNDKKPISTIFEEYEKTLKQIISCNPTIPSTTNALNKIYSHFKKKFTTEEKKLFLKKIEDFRNGNISLGKVLNDVDNYIQKYENGYLERQTFYLLYSDVEYDIFD